MYRLTRKGRIALQQETAGWERLTGAIGAVLKTAPGDLP
jgi:hypothetical protein